MIIDNEFKKLIALYKSNINTINSMLRIDFTYKKIKSFILFHPDEKNHFFIMVWKIKENYYLQNYQVYINNNNEFSFNPYIENIIYDNIKQYLGIEKNNVINYFREIFNKLDISKPLTESKRNIPQYSKNMSKDSIFFHHTKRSNLSPNMEKKLRNYYPNCNELINFLKSINHTAVFTNRFDFATNIYLYLGEKHPNSLSYVSQAKKLLDNSKKYGSFQS